MKNARRTSGSYIGTSLRALENRQCGALPYDSGFPDAEVAQHPKLQVGHPRFGTFRASFLHRDRGLQRILNLTQWQAGIRDRCSARVWPGIVHPYVEISCIARLAATSLLRTRLPSLRPQIRLRVVAVLCSAGFLPFLTSSAGSTSSQAAAKIASSPCSCQNSISNERSGNPSSTSRVFHAEF